MNEVSNLSQASYSVMEKVIAHGDLSALTSKERMMLYNQVCESLGLNPLTRPFQFIKFDGKLAFYASKDCTEQLRSLHSISIYKLEKDIMDGVFVCTAYARKPNGQEDIATGAVTIKGLQGKPLANAFKIAETQAKRRATLSICGLGWTDESEVPDIAGAKQVNVDFETGEIIEKIDDETITKLQFASNLENLKKAYAEAYRKYEHSPVCLEIITKIKDEKKAEIDKGIKEFQDEITRAENAQLVGDEDELV